MDTESSSAWQRNGKVIGLLSYEVMSYRFVVFVVVVVGFQRIFVVMSLSLKTLRF